MRTLVLILCIVFAPVLVAYALNLVPSTASSPSPRLPHWSPSALSQPGVGAHVIWDLTRSRDRSDVGWPPGYTPEMWFTKDHQTIDLLLPDGRWAHFEDVEAKVIGETDNSQVHMICIWFAPASLDQATAQASALLKDWGMSEGQPKLDAWREHVARLNLDRTSSDEHNFVFKATGHLYPRAINVQIRWLHVDGATPWSAQWEYALAPATPYVAKRLGR